MALSKSTKTVHGFDVFSAYFKVEAVSLIGKDKITFNVRAYKDSTESVPFTDLVYSCSYDLNNSNPIAQAYEYLKTLPEFADATDC